MALNGTFTLANGSAVTLIFGWTATQSAVSNSSTINWKITTGGDGSNTQIAAADFTINGTSVWSVDKNSPLFNIEYGSEIGSGTYTVTHDSTGNAKFTVAGTAVYGSTPVDFDIYQWFSDNEIFTLNTIDRKSSVSSTSGYIGDVVTITISRYVNTFTHTLTYTFGSASGTIVTKTSGTSIRWTLPSSFYNQITNAKSGTGTISCITYNGTNVIGTSTCKFTATVKEDDNTPIINPIVEDGNTVTSALTGDINKFVRYFSTAVYAINAQPRNGATIQVLTAQCGSAYNHSETGDFKNVESGKFVFSAMDSRNLITTQVVEKELIPYVKLTCNMSNDTPDTNGNFNFAISGNYFNGSFGAVNNTLTVQYRYKEQGGEFGAWTTPTNIIYTQSASNVVYSADVTITGLDYRATYVFEIKASDKLMNVASPQRVIKSTPVFDWSGYDFNFNVPVTYTDDTGEVYSISDMVMNYTPISDTDLKKIQGLLKSMSNRYEMKCEVGASTYYDSVDVSLFLYGNTMRGYMSAQRSSQVAAGNIANERVCQIEFDSGKKVIGFGAVSFSSGTDGGAATFQMTETMIYPDDGSISPESVGKGRFDITLCTATTAGDRWNAYFTFPCILDLTKF